MEESAPDSTKVKEVHSDQVEWEYSAQFFGFTARGLSDHMYRMVGEYITNALLKVEDMITSKFGVSLSEEQINFAHNAFLPPITMTMEKAFERFEAYTRDSIMKVPASAVLPSDRIKVEHPCTEEQLTQQMSEIQMLKKKIHCQKYVNSQLRQELADLQIVQGRLRSTLAVISSVEKVSRRYGVSDLRESMLYLKHTAKQLTNLLQTMPPEGSPHPEPIGGDNTCATQDEEMLPVADHCDFGYLKENGRQ